MPRAVAPDAVGQSEYFYIVDSTTGLPKTGLTHSDISAAYYTRTRAAAVQISSLSTLAAATSVWTAGGFKEVDSSNEPGVYRFDPPDACYIAGVPEVIIYLKMTSGNLARPIKVIIGQPADTVRWQGTLIPAPNVAGVPKVDVTHVGGIAAGLSSGTAQAGGASSITLALADTAGTNAYVDRLVTLVGGTGAGQSRLITAYNSGTKVATVHRAWDTQPDATSQYAIDSSSLGLLDVPASAHNISGTIGAKINSAASAGDPLGTAVPGSYGAGTVGFLIGTYLDAAVSAVKTRTDNLPADPAGLAGLVAAHGAGSWTTATSVAVSDKTGFELASDGLNLIVPADPGTIPVLGTANIATWIGYFGAWSTADVRSTSNSVTLRNAAGTVIATHATSDNGTTFQSDDAT